MSVRFLSIPLFSILALGAAAALPAAASAAGDPVKGKTVFARCMACHKVDASGTSGLGPNLYAIVGRPVASFKGYSYSPAMKARGGKWTAQTLDAYLSGPSMKAVPGTKMIFLGMPAKADRENLIAYLASVK